MFLTSACTVMESIQLHLMSTDHTSNFCCDRVSGYREIEYAIYSENMYILDYEGFFS